MRRMRSNSGRSSGRSVSTAAPVHYRAAVDIPGVLQAISKKNAGKNTPDIEPVGRAMGISISGELDMPTCMQVIDERVRTSRKQIIQDVGVAECPPRRTPYSHSRSLAEVRSSQPVAQFSGMANPVFVSLPMASTGEKRLRPSSNAPGRFLRQRHAAKWPYEERVSRTKNSNRLQANLVAMTEKRENRNEHS